MGAMASSLRGNSVQNTQKAYLELSHRSKMEPLRKTLMALSIFAKKRGF